MSNLSFVGGSGRSEALGRSSGDGTTVTSGGSSGTKGSYTSLGTTGFDWDGFTLFCSGLGVSRPCQLDVAIGATPDIIIADSFWYPFDSTCAWAAHFPVRVPASTALKVRTALNTNGNTSKWMAIGYQGDHLYRGFRRAEQLNSFSGAEPSTTVAESGTTQTAWTQLVASTSRAYGGLIIQGPDIVGSSPGGGVVLEIGVGGAGSEQSLGSTLWANNAQHSFNQCLMLADIPASSRIAFRSQSASAGTPTLGPSILGLVR
jgi:hypothetical protein